MADLTSVIRISGTINGRKIDVTSTMTMEDIYDTGIAQPGDNEFLFSSIGTGSGEPLTFAQDCPSYIMAINRSLFETGLVVLVNTGGASEYQFVLGPGQFAVFNEYQNGAGIMTINASATNIALEEVEITRFDKLPDIGFIVRGDIMVAFKAAS